MIVAMTEAFRMRVADVSWPGPSGAVVLTGVVDHGTLRGGGDLVLFGRNGETKTRVRRAFPAFPTPGARPGQMRPWPQRPGLFTIFAWGVDRRVASRGDVFVRFGPAEDE